jgi:hypothetical protein
LAKLIPLTGSTMRCCLILFLDGAQWNDETRSHDFMRLNLILYPDSRVYEIT